MVLVLVECSVSVLCCWIWIMWRELIYFALIDFQRSSYRDRCVRSKRLQSN